MHIIRQLPTGFYTFRDLSDYVLKRITSNSSTPIFFITDQYWKVSSKSCERNRQGRSGSIRITAIRPEQKLPKQQKKYLSLSSNKEELPEFLLQDWSSNQLHISQIREKEVFITVKAGANKIYNYNKFDLPASSRTLIESRSWYQSFLSSEVCTGNWVQGCCHIHRRQWCCYLSLLLCPNVGDQFACSNRIRSNYPVIDVRDHTRSNSIIKRLSSFQAISECDAVSAFHPIGRATWLSTIQKKEEYLDALRLLGETLEVDDNVFNTIERLVYHLYTVCRRNMVLKTHGTKNSAKVKLQIHNNYPQRTMNCNNMLSVAIISPMYGNKFCLPILTFLLHLVIGCFWEMIF